MNHNLFVKNLVVGQIINKEARGGREFEMHHVQAFDRDMRSEELLGECLTNSAGEYEITWQPSQITKNERRTADLVIKVFSPVNKTLLYTTPMDEVRFNAGEREVMNITLDVPVPLEVVEFDAVLQAVTGLAGDVAIADLQESAEHRDVTFLSKEAQIESVKIEHLVVAHRLQAASKVDADFFYALLRENTLLKNDFPKSLQARLAIGIDVPVLPLLGDASLLDAKTVLAAISKAVTDWVVAPTALRRVDKNLALLKKYQKDARAYYKNQQPKEMLTLLSRFVLEDKIGDIAKLFAENKNDLNGFIAKVTDPAFFKTKGTAKQAAAALELSKVLGFDAGIIAQVQSSLKVKDPADIKKLAALNKAEWVGVLTKSASAIEVAGEAMDAGLIGQHASALARKLEKAFPTEAFKAQLGRSPQAHLQQQAPIQAFLSANDGFDLANSNVDLLFNAKKLAGKSAGHSSAVREELKSMQRVFKLVPHFGKTQGLLQQKIHSAQGIAALGETRFVNEIAPKAGIAPVEAKAIFSRAARTNTAAMLVVGELQDTMRAMSLAAINTTTVAQKIEAVSKDFPNLKTLFTSGDVCACEHCRSVFSPAAYLVEVLQFLSHRGVVDLSTPTPRVTQRIAKDVLFERRPDLGEIDLSCDNANVPVPYIDLVCELLEEAVAMDQGVLYSGVLSDGADPLHGKISNALLATLTAAGIPVTSQAQVFASQAGFGFSNADMPRYVRDSKAVCKIVKTSFLPNDANYSVLRLRQTLSTADEIAAAPEYVNAQAYNVLKTANYAFGLPFDLDHAEATAYFNRLGVARADLMTDFQVSGTPANASIATERLGLTDAERLLITVPAAMASAQQQIWGTTTPNAADELKVVDTFLTKTGLSYKELNLLLTLKFIDPQWQTTGNPPPLFIRHLDLSCDTTQKHIVNLNDVALDRIHRFLRLQKKTGWKLELLDELISQPQLGAGTLDDACLINMAGLKQIAKATSIKLDELVGFFGEIPHQPWMEDGPVPLYTQVFLNKAKNGFVDAGLQPANVSMSPLLAGYVPSIAVCLQLKELDVTQLLALLPPNPVLSFANVSTLFAAARLIHKLKLKVEDLLCLVTLNGGLAFNSSPDALWALVQAAQLAKKHPLKLADVQFMLRHEATPLAAREIPDAKIKTILETLQKELQKNYSNNLSLYDDGLSAEEQKETLQSALAKLPGIAAADVNTCMGFFDKNWTTVSDAQTFVTATLGGVLNISGINIRIGQLAIMVTLTDIEVTQKKLAKEYFDAFAVYHLALGKQLVLENLLVKTFKTDLNSAKRVLKFATLKQAALPATVGLISEILSSNSFIDQVNAVPVLPAITENASFTGAYQSVRLLHKMLHLIASFKLSNEQIEWHFQNNALLGWLEWDAIPYQAGQAAVAYAKYVNFVDAVNLEKQLKPVPDPLDLDQPITYAQVMDLTLASTSSVLQRDEFVRQLALLLGYSAGDVKAVDDLLYLPSGLALTGYQSVQTWRRVMQCAAHARSLDMSVEHIEVVIKPVLTGGDTMLLRTALKARYEESTWLSTLKEIMDTVRPLKRNALVAYLLATNRQWGIKNTNDLYDYFLVDVEMEACMPSSRIVQAHLTVQLFVQRCLMGLEPKTAADLTADKSWGQWTWMKNYRVWEANCKVFLYPENWLEAELRDDKSYLFTELENEIKQVELNDFSAEQAYIHYLEKLDGISFLEVMATWYQSDIKIMHVFARTKGGDPAIYYYRKLEQERTWSAWEKVEVDITGNQLLAFVRNNRLSLAWPVFSDVVEPKQGAKLPDQSVTVEQPIGEPRIKTKIQIAVSEFANKQWQPKKVSADGILTPDNYTNKSDIQDRDRFNLMYLEQTDQIRVFTTNADNRTENHQLNGIFDIAGCKGYPELALLLPVNKNLPDFLPDFEETLLTGIRYKDWSSKPNNNLVTRNGVSFYAFYQILAATPDRYKLTYPHQMTLIDMVSMLVQYFLSYFHGGKPKVTLGTLLPYFKEDSKQAYIVIPGLYSVQNKPGTKDEVLVQRTASNVVQLIEDIVALIRKYTPLFQNLKAKEQAAVSRQLLKDPDYQAVINELKIYFTLSFGEQFKNMYHPLMCALRKTLYTKGLPAMMERATQLQKTPFDFDAHYKPQHNRVVKNYVIQTNPGTNASTNLLSYPIEDVDFSVDGSYSEYNWELFFHIPMLLATRLTKNQRFEEALKWFHYMFNPTGALEGDAPQKYWVTKPFYLANSADYQSQRIDTLLYALSNPASPVLKELEFAVDQWRKNPFKPHAVARLRPAAYSKALLMKYIDNLTDWGDYLFRQETMESIAQATQMYILADKLLGPKPRVIPPIVKPPYETYNQMQGKLDAFSNALVDMENLLPDLSALPEQGAELPPNASTLSMLYFCIPQNDKITAYWDKIADRLFKIRHCQNIDGIERSLALFAPPIDPGMMVRAAAAGLDMSSILAGINAPTPYYRFNVLSQKATELAQEVRGLGSSLLQALEKKDAEAMSLLRSEMEIKVLNAVTDMKLLQIQESAEQIEILRRTKRVTEERHQYYANIERVSDKEQLNLDKLGEAHGLQLAAQICNALGGALALIPDANLGAAGFGGTPTVGITYGGFNLNAAAKSAGDVLNIISSVASYEASRAATKGGYERRADDWAMQERTTGLELQSIDSQIVAAEIRNEIAKTDLKNHKLQIENSQKSDEFMRTKFSNVDLYDWMIGQISSVYFSAYQMAHDFAKKAERSYRFELGNSDTFIDFGYWDTRKKGLQSADKLIHDIKRMETSYLDKNKREYEITKHISLAMLDPLAIIKLRNTGVCDFDIPEVLYDMDHPGQYFRRLKSVSVSMPCIAGPYTSISAKLSLVSNKYRKSTGGDYAEIVGNDERFVYNLGAIQSIATSSAQNDSGVFELNFKDERYVPFEGCGALSTWRLELPQVAQFDYDTIADVVLHVKYTAREGGSQLKTAAETVLLESLDAIKQKLSETGLHIAIDMKHDMPNEWNLLKSNGVVDIVIDKARLPYMAQALIVSIDSLRFVAKLQGNPATFDTHLNGALASDCPFDSAWELNTGLAVQPPTLGVVSTLSVPASLSELVQLMLVVKYSVSI